MSVAGSGTSLVQDEHGRPAALPNDPALLRELIEALLKQLTAAQVENHKLKHELEALKRGLWGRKSEKLDANQLMMFAELLAKHGLAMPEAPAPEAPPAPKRTGATPSGGRALIAEHLPRETVTYRLSPEQRTCPKCGRERTIIGHNSRERLEIVPVQLVVLEERQEKGLCTACEEFVTAEMPRPAVEKVAAGPGLLAHLVVSKIDDHLPVYRQCEILKRHGVAVPAATVGRWVLMVAGALRPLHAQMAQRVKCSKVIETDETRMPVQQPGHGQTHNGRMWVFRGDVRQPYVVYHYTPTKESKGPKDWLRGYRGDLQADAYGGFDQLYVEDAATGTKIREVACNAHARRKFESIKLNFPAPALVALQFYRRLYAIEDDARRMSKHRRRRLRRKEARPIWAEFRAWLDAIEALELPNSELGKALRYSEVELDGADALRQRAAAVD